jgi:membrane protein implicated in regulation of membrane protease activity
MVNTDDSPAGKTGYVTVAIPGRGRPGEVRVAIRGGSEAFIAYADEPIERGKEVIVIGDRGARSVDVIAG